MDLHKDSEVGSEPPERKRIGEGMGFRHVEAGPLVRSSYHAERQVPRTTEPLRTRATEDCSGALCARLHRVGGVATGFLAHRHPGDLVFTGYRDHPHALLLGTDPGAVMAELFGAEIAACISERAFDQLDAPFERVTGADVPMPYARNLELLSVPHEGEVMAAARRTLYLEA
jgi:hypothetical protein